MNETPDFERVYTEHAGYVRRVLQRMGVRPADIDDVVQDTFVTIYRLLPEFEGRSSMETWLYAVCWKVAARYHRRSRPRDSDAGIAASSWSIDGEFGAARMMASMEGVEPHDLDLFVLHEIGGLSISELAELTGNARATLRRHVDRARAVIQRALGSKAPPERPVGAEPTPPPERISGVFPRIYLTPDVCVAQHVHTICARWRNVSTVEALEFIHDLLLRAASETTGDLTFISIIEPDAPPPDRACREVMRRTMVRVGHRMRATGFVALSPGVFALLPPIINACLFLSRTTMNVRFFSDQRLGLRWLSQYLTGGATHDSLLAHTTEMGRLLDETCRAAAASLASPGPPGATVRPMNERATTG